jgi:hypothetical protein
MAIKLLPEGLWEVVEPFIPVVKAKSKGRKAALSRQGMSHGHCIRPVQWDSLGEATDKKWAVTLE